MIRLLLILLVISLLALPSLPVLAESGPALSLLAINVRKADALLLRSGQSAYLIDTGSEESAPALLIALREEGVSRLDGVILTHTHKDHVGGLEALLASDITIDGIYASGFYNKKKESKHPAVKAVKGTDLKVTFLFAGDTLPLDGGSLTVIGPLEKDDDTENNNSLVLLAEGGGGKILLTGDMEFPEEKSLLKAGVIPAADVLKIANHGERDATSYELVSTVSPSLAVISTNSDDEPDTPSPLVLQVLAACNVDVLLTEKTERGVEVIIQNGEITTHMK